MKLHQFPTLWVCLTAFVLMHTPQSWAQDPFATTIRPTEPLTPEEQLKTFHVPAGFKIELFAAEPQIQKPMNMAFDGAGRLWVSGSVEYPFAAAEGEGRDTIRVLRDADGDGHAESIETFADGLNIPMGLYPYGSGVVAYSIPHIWNLQDMDGDGQCDRRDILYGDLGEPVDTHGMQNAFRRGYDGWLYICHGFRNESTIRGTDGSEVRLQSGNTYRVRLDGSRVEQFTWGQVNPFGSTFLPNGDLITADCHSKPLTMLLRGGHFSSFGKPHDGLGYVPSIMEHGHGSTAIAGAAFYDGDGFPEPYRGSLFVGNVMTSRIHRDSLVWHGSSLEAHEEQDFITCDDPWFRPVDIQIGPDGALYISDFYNRIIGHYEVDLNHPGRDKTRGRIWRVSYVGDQGNEDSNRNDLSKMSAKDLIKALADSSMQVRSLATDQLSDRIGIEAKEDLVAFVTSNAPVQQRAHALWVLHRLGEVDEAVLSHAARSDSPLLRQHAMRVISEFGEAGTSVRRLAISGLQDESALVRRAAADAVGRLMDQASVTPLLNCWKQAASDDVHLQHAVMIALKSQLGAEGAFEGLQLTELNRETQSMLARIAVAVPTSEAAEFLINAIETGLADSTQMKAQLAHVATHARADSIDKVVRLVRRLAQDDIDLQVELIALLQQQMAQRGVSNQPDIHSWGRELVENLLSDGESEAMRWNAVSGAQAWGLERRNCEDGKRDVVFLSSLPGGERTKGAIRSPVFELPPVLSFYLCGHLGFPDKDADLRNVVRLRLEGTNKIVRTVHPPRNDTAKRVEWSLDEFAGKRGYVEVVDGLDIRAFAWLAVSRFDPPVIKLPQVAPNVTSTRQIAAAAISRALRLEDFSSALSKLAVSESTPINVRAACAETLVSFARDSIGQSLLVALKDDAVPRSTKATIASRLCQLEPVDLEPLLAEVLEVIPARIESQIGETLALNRTGAEVLLRFVSSGHISARILQRPSVLRSLEGTLDRGHKQRISELTAGLPPANQQIAKLILERTKGFSSANKSAANGKQLFAKHCAACHQVGGVGALIGPQLDGIGSRGLERVAEDLLDPNRNIDVAFHVTVLAMNDGRVLSGLERRAEGKAKIFAGNDGKEFTVRVDDIDEQRKSRTSIMPDNFGSVLPEQDCYDLLSYLVSLRAKPKQTQEFSTSVFESGSDGYHTYRIPGIVATTDSTLIAICEGRKTSRSDHGDVDLVMKRSQDGGKTWSNLSLIYEEGGSDKITIGNPCPVVDRDTGTIWLPFTRDNDDVLITSSTDGGNTWSTPRDITSDVKRDDWTWYATGPGNGIQIELGQYKGRLVIPCDHRVEGIADRKQSSRSHVIYSDDHGATWQLGDATAFRMNECAVAELSDGRLMLNMRSNRGLGQRGIAFSSDGGKSWSECVDDPALIEPVCQASLIRFSWGDGASKSRLLFSNPASSSKREKMTVRISYDEGKTWPASHEIHAGSSAYSCLVALPNDGIGVLYERDRYHAIVFDRIALSTIEGLETN